MSKNTREGLELNTVALQLADLIKKNAVVEGGSISVPKDAYPELLAAGGVTAAEERKVQDFHAHLTTATALAGGELGVAHLKKHKDLKEVSIVLNAGKDQISATIAREGQSRNPATGETSTVYGQARVRYRTFGSVAGRGNLKTTTDHIRRMAEAELG